jgi:mono/diheme cytochrome c family protein
MVQEDYFYPYSLQRSALRKKLALASGAKRLKLQKRLAATRKKLKESKEPCTSGAPGSGGGFPTLCYDGFGNLSAAGKAKHQVPAHLNGNIGAGSAVYQAYCAGCHMERPRSFPLLRHAISEEPMYFSSSEIPDAALADLVAYLQRFTTLCS